MLNVSDAIGQDTTEYRRNGIAREPQACSESMLRRLVPYARDESEARANGAFKDAQEDTEYGERSEARCSSMATKDNRPDDPIIPVSLQQACGQGEICRPRITPTYIVTERYFARGSLMKPNEAG